MVHYYMVANEFNKHKTLLHNIMSKSAYCSEILIEINKELNDFNKSCESHEKELKILYEKIKNHSIKKDVLEKELKDLDVKLRETEEIVGNTTVILPIIIDENNTNYNLMNGLVDSNRDIVMKLFIIIHDDNKIKNIIGMGKIFYAWSKQRIFCWVRNSLRQPLAVQYKLNSSTNVIVCESSVEFIDYGAMFLDYDFSSGIFNMNMRVRGFVNDNPNIYIGCTDITDIDTIMKQTWERYVPGVFYFLDKENNHAIKCNENCYVNIESRYCAYNGLLIGVEINSFQKTMLFFHNNQPIPFVVRNIPPSAVLGFLAGSIKRGVSVAMESVYLERRLHPSVDLSIVRTFGTGEWPKK